MPYLINPGGRFVAVPDEDYEKFRLTPGFTVPTPEEVTQFIKEREAVRQAMTNPEPEDQSAIPVYLSTVSQGAAKDGYGIASKAMISGLQKAGVNVSTHNSGQKIALLFHNPYSVLKLEAPYRIIYTMFESDKIPDDWSEYLEAADEILVPSKWCAETFKKAGFKTKVVPLGFDDQIFKYKKRENKRKKRQDFVFLHYNAFNIRKGFLEVFKAFNKAFKKDEPVKMIFKTTLDTMPLPITKSEYPNIEVINAKYTQAEMLELLYRSDCFVFPSRGEGFGMTPLEAMATGIPAIVPNAHGITEYFDERFMYEAKVAETCPGIYSRYKGIDVGKMVICDVDQIAAQMRYIYEHQDEALAKGKAAAEYVKQWTFDKTCTKLKEIFEKANKLDLDSRPPKNSLNLEVVR